MSIVKLHEGAPADDIVATLRRIADDLEAGEYGLVTTAVLCLGHSTQKRVDEELHSHVTCDVFGLGPRCDVFTVRGLLTTALMRT